MASSDDLHEGSSVPVTVNSRLQTLVDGALVWLSSGTGIGERAV